jgi:hypothetical protein
MQKPDGESMTVQEKGLLHDAVMNLNLESKVKDPKFQRILRTDPNFIKQIKFLYTSLVRSEVDFNGLVKNQRFSSILTEYEIHYLIVKAAIEECEIRIQELLQVKPVEESSNLIRKKPNPKQKLLDFQLNKKDALQLLKEKFIRRLKREDDFDAGKLKFRIPGPEAITKTFPYYSYKKNRFKILKCANVGYVEKYVKNGQNMEYSGLGKLKAREKQEKERERLSLLAHALEKKKEAQLASQNPTLQEETKKPPADMPEEIWLVEQLKQFEEEKERERIKEKWKSAENCLHYLNKTRKKLKNMKAMSPPRSPEKKNMLNIQRRPSSASSRLSRFAPVGQGQKNEDSVSCTSSATDNFDEKNIPQDKLLNPQDINPRSPTPKISYRDFEKPVTPKVQIKEEKSDNFRRQTTIAEAEIEEGKETEETPPMPEEDVEIVKLKEVEMQNPFEEDSMHQISDFGKTISDFARTDGFQRERRQSLFEIQESEDVPSKFEEDFNKILNIKNTIDPEEKSSERKRGTVILDESVDLSESHQTKSSFYPKNRPSTTSHARRASTGTTWMQSAFAHRSELLDMSLDKMNSMEEKIQVANFLTEMTGMHADNVRIHKKVERISFKHNERMATFDTTLRYCRDLAYAEPSTLQSMYQYQKGDLRERDIEQKEAIHWFHEDEKMMELKVVRFKKDTLKKQLKVILDRKRILTFDKTYNV